MCTVNFSLYSGPTIKEVENEHEDDREVSGYNKNAAKKGSKDNKISPKASKNETSYKYLSGIRML